MLSRVLAAGGQGLVAIVSKEDNLRLVQQITTSEEDSDRDRIHLQQIANRGFVVKVMLGSNSADAAASAETWRQWLHSNRLELPRNGTTYPGSNNASQMYNAKVVADAIYKLRSPFVVPYFKLFSTPSELRIIMPRYSMTLQEWALKQPHLTQHQVVSIAIQITSGLMKCLDAGILHLDLHSENVYVANSNAEIPHCVLADFESSYCDGLSRTISSAFTEQFAAPERQTLAAAASSTSTSEDDQKLKQTAYQLRKADVFSLGVLLLALGARHQFPGLAEYLPQHRDQGTSAANIAKKDGKENAAAECVFLNYHLLTPARIAAIVRRELPIGIFSDVFVSLITMMLNHDPLTRPQLETILRALDALSRGASDVLPFPMSLGPFDLVAAPQEVEYTRIYSNSHSYDVDNLCFRCSVKRSHEPNQYTDCKDGVLHLPSHTSQFWQRLPVEASAAGLQPSVVLMESAQSHHNEDNLSDFYISGEATYGCYLYPFACDAAVGERLVHSATTSVAARASLLQLNGAFAVLQPTGARFTRPLGLYIPINRSKPINNSALHNNTTDYDHHNSANNNSRFTMYFSAAQPWPSSCTAKLHRDGRIHTEVPSLLGTTATCFSWLNPGETFELPNGQPWMPAPHGGFVFWFSPNASEPHELDRYFAVSAEAANQGMLPKYPAVPRNQQQDTSRPSTADSGVLQQSPATRTGILQERLPRGAEPSSVVDNMEWTVPLSRQSQRCGGGADQQPQPTPIGLAPHMEEESRVDFYSPHYAAMRSTATSHLATVHRSGAATQGGVNGTVLVTAALDLGRTPAAPVLFTGLDAVTPPTMDRGGNYGGGGGGMYSEPPSAIYAAPNQQSVMLVDPFQNQQERTMAVVPSSYPAPPPHPMQPYHPQHQQERYAAAASLDRTDGGAEMAVDCGGGGNRCGSTSSTIASSLLHGARPASAQLATFESNNISDGRGVEVPMRTASAAVDSRPVSSYSSLLGDGAVAPTRVPSAATTFAPGEGPPVSRSLEGSLARQASMSATASSTHSGSAVIRGGSVATVDSVATMASPHRNYAHRLPPPAPPMSGHHQSHPSSQWQTPQQQGDAMPHTAMNHHQYAPMAPARNTIQYPPPPQTQQPTSQSAIWDDDADITSVVSFNDPQQRGTSSTSQASSSAISASVTLHAKVMFPFPVGDIVMQSFVPRFRIVSTGELGNCGPVTPIAHAAVLAHRLGIPSTGVSYLCFVVVDSPAPGASFSPDRLLMERGGAPGGGRAAAIYGANQRYLQHHGFILFDVHHQPVGLVALVVGDGSAASAAVTSVPGWVSLPLIQARSNGGRPVHPDPRLIGRIRVFDAFAMSAPPLHSNMPFSSQPTIPPLLSGMRPPIPSSVTSSAYPSHMDRRTSSQNIPQGTIGGGGSEGVGLYYRRPSNLGPAPRHETEAMGTFTATTAAEWRHQQQQQQRAMSQWEVVLKGGVTAISVNVTESLVMLSDSEERQWECFIVQ